jgi:hypothetical protein
MAQLATLPEFPKGACVGVPVVLGARETVQIVGVVQRRISSDEPALPVGGAVKTEGSLSSPFGSSIASEVADWPWGASSDWPCSRCTPRLVWLFVGHGADNARHGWSPALAA